MIRIAYIVTTIDVPTAGTEQQLLMLLRHLDPSHFEPTLVCLRSSPWLQEQVFPFRVVTLDLASLRSLSFLKACRVFAKLHQQRRFDIVQTFTVDANYYGTVAAHWAGVPTIVSTRRDTGYWQTPWLRLLLQVLRRWTPYYLANSKAAARACVEKEKVENHRITVIYNGVDLSRFERIPGSLRATQRAEWNISEADTLVGLVANLRPVKNVGALIDSAQRLCPEIPRLRFVVVGEGADRGVLQARIDRAGLSQRFLLAGAVQNVVPALAAFDIGVLCSHAESFSNSLIEYMAAGLPVVASAVGGAAEAIQHELTGLLYDSTQAGGLDKALRALVRDRAMARRIGRAAQADAIARFGRETFVARHEEFYTDIVGRRKAAPDATSLNEPHGRGTQPQPS